MDAFTLNPIGYVENNISNRKEMSSPGIKSIIKINETYIDGLKYLEENSHIIVLCYLNEANRSVLRVFPKKYGIESNTEKGVFATRSPDRPNPVAISVTRLLEINENKLIVEPLDMINGTPVIDIKPYSVGSDCIFNTLGINNRREYHVLPEDKLYEFLVRGFNNYIFNIDSSLDLGIYSIIKLIYTLKIFPDRDSIESIETNYTTNALDCLYYYFKFTPGEERIIITKKDTLKRKYLKVILKSNETWKLTYNNSLDNFVSDLLEIKKL